MERELQHWIDEARAALEQLREGMRAKYDRDLPLEELLSDRWERARSLGFGEGTSIYHNSYVYGPVKVGRNTWIGPFTLLDGTGGLEIGSTCSISSGVQIYTHDTVKWAVSGGTAAYERAPVRIGDACYIGPQSVIAKGVTIGEHSVVGAHSFVNRDIPPYTVAAGAPCRAIGRVVIGDGGEVRLEMHA
jgi:acetyltransferase-like isoleucine patch superfamily enzyme